MDRSPDLVRPPAAIDAAWMTAVLESAGVAGGASVVSLAATSIGTGQVGENIRFALRWDDADGRPATVVGKFPSTSDASRAIAAEVDSYAKEVGFYRELLPEVAIRTPQVHHVGWQADTHDFVIVMEDIRAAEQGDQLEGCDVDRARLAVDGAIGLHAPTWGRPDLATGRPWLARNADVGPRIELFRMLTPGFIDRYRERLTTADLELTGALVDRLPVWAEATTEWGETNGWCVTHGDYRLDNMLFGSTATAPPLTVVDWQTVVIGVGPTDIAYFCGAALADEVRADSERALVERYRVGLADAGVSISSEAAWSGYVLGSVTGLYMAVLASQVVARTERGDEMFAVMAERHAAQIRAVGLVDMLDAV